MRKRDDEDIPFQIISKIINIPAHQRVLSFVFRERIMPKFLDFLPQKV